jgi:hypothetical protein
MKIIKTTAEIQRKWDMILCRFIATKIRHKEAYYDIARFALGHGFNGSRSELHVFVVSLGLERLVEFTKWKNVIGHYAKDDFMHAIGKHSQKFLNDCFKLDPPIVMMQIEEYKWKDLASERVMLSERRTCDNSHTYASKSGIGAGKCSDWLTVK